MATLPADDLRITKRFGPHLSAMTGVRLSTTVEPETLVKTHCCFCGQQCGLQLKVRDNQVIGFEPWEEFPFNWPTARSAHTCRAPSCRRWRRG